MRLATVKAGHAGLARAEEFAGSAEFEIKFGDLEAVAGADHGLEAALAFFGDFAAGHENAVRLGSAAADASAKLVELRRGRNARRAR